MRVVITDDSQLSHTLRGEYSVLNKEVTTIPAGGRYVRFDPTEVHPHCGVHRQILLPEQFTVVEQHATTEGYPDGNPKSAQGAKKYSLRYLPLSASIEVNRALEDGAKKYGAANWREKGVAASVYVDACKRHLDLYFDCKQDNASDSGVHNLGHAMACLAIIIDAEKAGTLTDDRPFPFPDGDKLLMRG